MLKECGWEVQNRFMPLQRGQNGRLNNIQLESLEEYDVRNGEGLFVYDVIRSAEAEMKGYEWGLNKENRDRPKESQRKMFQIRRQRISQVS